MEKRICEFCKNKYSINHKSQRFCSMSCAAKKCQEKNVFHWSHLDENKKIERLKNSFEKKVIKKEGCWDWNGPSQPNGYIRIRFNVDKIGAHRASWMIFNGKIPECMQINHHCDNRRCTNPEHLYLGTRKQNDEDRIKRNRQAKGKTNGASKLNEEDILKIKKLITMGMSDKSISIDFKVSPACIWWIRTGKRWKHILV